jgi:hypothetical protein
MYPAHLLTHHLTLRERIAVAIDDISLGRMDLAAIGDFLGEVIEGITEEVTDAVSSLEREKRDLEQDLSNKEAEIGRHDDDWVKLHKRPKLWVKIAKIIET